MILEMGMNTLGIRVKKVGYNVCGSRVEKVGNIVANFRCQLGIGNFVANALYFI